MIIKPEVYINRFDFIIIGSGVAGLTAANILKNHGHVLIVSNRKKTECNTSYAQGGVAVVMNTRDSFDKHSADTIKAGAGLCIRPIVDFAVKEGPAAINDLILLGAAFDRKGAKLYFTKEGAHSEKRVIHCFGDGTGKEIERALLSGLLEKENITFLEDCPVVDLITEDGCVKGIIFFNDKNGKFFYAVSKITILASGGIGGLYTESSNPGSITGSGFGLASKAGALLRDMEFIQFHPTVFFTAGTGQKFLITEAMRGEGAILLNKHGIRFMEYYHKDKELAPRDVVSRAIYNEMLKQGNENVWLDISHKQSNFIKSRFPNIHKTLLQYKIDITRDKIPVKPAAHYIMGGVLTDVFCRTTLPGLLSCGECSSTGMHGANRLASNSLLEGLVFGKIAAITALNDINIFKEYKHGKLLIKVTDACNNTALATHLKNLKNLLWQNAGIIREENSLIRGIKELENISKDLSDYHIPSKEFSELNNMLITADAILQSALNRKESIGAHFRKDYPFRTSNVLKHSYY